MSQNKLTTARLKRSTASCEGSPYPVRFRCRHGISQYCEMFSTGTRKTRDTRHETREKEKPAPRASPCLVSPCLLVLFLFLLHAPYALPDHPIQTCPHPFRSRVEHLQPLYIRH